MGPCGNNCTAWQKGTEQKYQADPDIAGIGVSLALANRQLQMFAFFGEQALTCRMHLVDYQCLHREHPHHSFSISRAYRPYQFCF